MPLPHNPINKVFVSSDKRFNDEYALESGLKLYKDTSFDEEWSVVTKCVVESLPIKFIADVNNEGKECEVNPGDTVYVHYFTLLYKDDMVDIDKKEYYAVEYNKVFVKIINGAIQPVHGYCLIKVDTELTGEKTKGGIIIPDMLRKKKVDTYGELAFVHNDYRFPAKKGDTVYFQKDFAYQSEIEGDDYYVIQSSELQAYRKKGKAHGIEV